MSQYLKKEVIIPTEIQMKKPNVVVSLTSEFGKRKERKIK